MIKLKHTEIKKIREEQTKEQDNQCALCLKTFTLTDRIVLDHNHKTGHIRGALHHTCNSFLGKLENASVRFRIDLEAVLPNIMNYKDKQLPYIHPTFFTPEEKIQRNKLKRKKKPKAKYSKEPLA